MSSTPTTHIYNSVKIHGRWPVFTAMSSIHVQLICWEYFIILPRDNTEFAWGASGPTYSELQQPIIDQLGIVINYDLNLKEGKKKKQANVNNQIGLSTEIVNYHVMWSFTTKNHIEARWRIMF